MSLFCLGKCVFKLPVFVREVNKCCNVYTGLKNVNFVWSTFFVEINCSANFFVRLFAVSLYLFYNQEWIFMVSKSLFNGMKVICWWYCSKIHQKIENIFKSDIIQITKLTLDSKYFTIFIFFNKPFRWLFLIKLK